VAAAAATAALAASVPAYAATVWLLLGAARLRAGDAAGAVEAAEATQAAAGALGDPGARSAAVLLHCAASRSAVDQALAALATAADLGLLPVVADGLDVVAALVVDAGSARTAARLQGAADRLREDLGAVPSPLAALLRTADGPAVAAALGETAATEARLEGAALDAAAAVAFAQRARGRRGRPTSGWDSLTPTERAVVALVAEGLTNQRVGERLLMTAGTVRTHLRSVFAKLDVASRTELAAAFSGRAG
jgi:DNA-binding CsgD family transcriptional regulator